MLPACFLPFFPSSLSFLPYVETLYKYSLAFREVRIASTDTRRRLTVTILPKAFGSRALAVHDCDRGGALGSATGTFTILTRDPNTRYYPILLKRTKKNPEKSSDVVGWRPSHRKESEFRPLSHRLPSPCRKAPIAVSERIALLLLAKSSFTSHSFYITSTHSALLSTLQWRYWRPSPRRLLLARAAS